MCLISEKTSSVYENITIKCNKTISVRKYI